MVLVAGNTLGLIQQLVHIYVAKTSAQPASYFFHAEESLGNGKRMGGVSACGEKHFRVAQRLTCAQDAQAGYRVLPAQF